MRHLLRVTLAVTSAFAVAGLAGAGLAPARAVAGPDARAVKRAAAATVTVTFEDLSPGAVLTGQYHTSQGVDFGTGPVGTETAPVVEAVPAGVAAAGTRVAGITPSCGGEFCRYNGVVKFQTLQQKVQLRLGPWLHCNSGTEATAIVADNAGNTLGSPQTYLYKNGAEASVKTPVSFDADSPSIRYLRVYGDGCRMAIDDLSFDKPSGALPPDFSLARADTFGGAIGLSAGESRTVQLFVSRTGGSNGAISFSATAPSGVTVTFSPSSVSGSNDAGVAATVKANANSGGAKGDIVIRATPSAGAGPSPRDVTVPVVVSAYYDLRVRGIDVTQGSQTTKEVLIAGISGALQTSPVLKYSDQSDVPLIRTKRTIARVYADALTAPKGGVPGTGVLLYGTDSAGKALPQSPLVSEEGTRTLDVGPAALSELRGSSTGAFTFTLPPSWSDGPGPIKLSATVFGPNQGPSGLIGGPELVECSSAACGMNNSFTISEIRFAAVLPATIRPLSVVYTRNGAQVAPRDPASVFDAALAAMPFGSQITVLPYQDTLDVTTEANLPGVDDGDDAKNDAIYGRVKGWTANFMFGGGLQNANLFPGAVIGVIGAADPTQPAPARGSACEIDCFSGVSCSPSCAGNGMAIVDENRPLSSVAHELGHLFDLQHAHTKIDTAGGCGTKESDVGPGWPDPQGGLEGFALDPRPGSGGSASPYQVFGSGGPGAPIASFDIMSYCGGDGNEWLSPINWKYIASRCTISCGPLSALLAGVRGYQASPAGTSAAVVKVLHVIASDRGRAGVQIESVESTQGLLPAAAASRYSLVVRNGVGAALSTTPMVAVVSHVNRGGGVVHLDGTAPATDAAMSVEITVNGRVVARRLATKPPQVTAVQVARFAGRGTATLAWTAADPDSSASALLAKIEYSLDDGSSWRTVWTGPNRGEAIVPAYYLAQARSARLRVSLNDGFNQASGTSAQFSSPGAPPVVRITSPQTRERIHRDDVLSLTGQAFDDRARRLTRGNLVWFLGRRRVAVGERAAIADLPSGPATLRLVARDTNGKTSSASVQLRIEPVTPRVLQLVAPPRVSLRARTLTFAISTSVPAVLYTGSRRFVVGRSLRKITVPIAPRRGPLLVSFRLTADGRTVSEFFRVNR